MLMTPRNVITLSITRWEGLFQSDPNDHGNYVTGQNGSRVLVGTMRGVTAETYAEYIGVPGYQITKQILESEVTAEVAADIGMSRYFIAPRLNALTWNQFAAIAVDISWMSGPSRAITLVQEVIGQKIPYTDMDTLKNICDDYIFINGIKQACINLVEFRTEFFKHLAQENSKYYRFLKDWTERSQWFLPDSKKDPQIGEKSWWECWEPSAPVSATGMTVTAE